ncbi:hypothetical protein DY000_02060306 [Brassica cretica]|uniref:Uncharacterized protein n=1 Tax=Brassica cretica TaxID=69181 RepID=A0ABQ7AWT2_BRACR|nr:hypothetical protein DY000_02060306 [Brassica cretica]
MTSNDETHEMGWLQSSGDSIKELARMHGFVSYRFLRKHGRYVATEPCTKLSRYVATELRGELGRYVATEPCTCSVAMQRASFGESSVAT